jgi:hypothetical protein
VLTDLEKEASERFDSGRFLDAAGKFAAATQAATDSGEPQARIDRFRAWERLSQGRHFLFEEKDTLSDPAKLARAADAFADAERLFDTELGRVTARGYKEWMLGHNALLAGFYDDGAQHCKKAEEAFSQVIETPGLPEGFLGPIQDSLRQVKWDILEALIIKSAVVPEALGEARAMLERLKPEMPADRAQTTEFQIAVIAPVLNGYDGGVRLAERWDPTARRYFESMEKPLKAWLANESLMGQRWQPTLGHMATGWGLVCKAEIHHAEALRELFERGSPSAARNEVSKAADTYREAELEFGQAGMQSGLISSVRDRADVFTQRARILTEATAPHQGWAGMGRWFVLFFLITLVALAAVQWATSQHIDVGLTIWTSLFVGLVGGFTRHAPVFLGYLNRFFGSSGKTSASPPAP